jgi:hypothetical protein
LIGILTLTVIAKTMTSRRPAAENMTRCIESVRKAEQINPNIGSRREGGMVLVKSLFST